MPRRVGLAALLVVVIAVAAGCGTSGESTGALPTEKAPPQHAVLGWTEPYPAEQPALVFGVDSFTVTRDGWRAEISVQNRSGVSWEVNNPRYAAEREFGVMLFPTNDQKDLERRSQQRDLPAIRPATSYSPELPAVLRAGTTWRGTISAPGALAAGLWLRVSFGPFVSEGIPPAGTESPVGWITDHAYHLAEVATEPA